MNAKPYNPSVVPFTSCNVHKVAFVVAGDADITNVKNVALYG